MHSLPLINMERNSNDRACFQNIVKMRGEMKGVREVMMGTCMMYCVFRALKNVIGRTQSGQSLKGFDNGI
jgi:hypothetical protein